MKTGMELAVLAAEVERQQEAKIDYVAPTSHLTVQTATEALTTANGTEIPVGETLIELKGADEELLVLDLTHEQIGRFCGIPKGFYERLRHGAIDTREKRPANPALLDRVVNELLREQPKKRMVRSLDGRARAFVSNRYRRLDNYDLLEAALPVIGEMPDAQIRSANLTDRHLYLKVVLPGIQAEVRQGDIVAAGFCLTNSEVGLGALGIELFVERLVCENGMISTIVQRAYHAGKQVGGDSPEAVALYTDETLQADDRAFFLKARDLVRHAVDETRFQSVVAQMKELAGTAPTTDPVECVERLANKVGLLDREKTSVLTHLVQGGDLTAYGVVNAVTRASADVPSYDRATEMERIGGRLLDLTSVEWQHMSRPVLN